MGTQEIMYKALIFIIAIITIPIGCRPLIVSQYFDKEWKPTEKENASYYRIAKYDSTGTLIGVVRDYYMSGKLQFEGKLLQNTPPVFDGLCSWYYENGKIQSKIEYKSGEIHGLKEVYYKDGQLMRKQFVINDHSEGMELFYYPNGELKEVCEYKNGYIKDTCRKFHLNGQLDQLTVRSIINNDVYVEFTRWQPDGTIFQTYGSKNGNMYGDYRSNHPNGTIHYQKKYGENGELLLDQTFDNQGNIERSWRIEDDTLR